MKKLALLMMGFILVFSLAACGSSNQTSSTSGGGSETTATEAPAATAATPAQTEGGSDTGAGNGGALVVYYSATGNTEEAANYIAAATGGDIFELEPVEPYMDDDLDWTDDNSRVSVEHENPDQRDVELVSTTVPDWDSYDTVFIGYPIWWGIAAWPVDGFIEANDFTGKTVIPFCTSSSSGLGESGQLLEETAGTETGSRVKDSRRALPRPTSRSR